MAGELAGLTPLPHLLGFDDMPVTCNVGLEIVSQDPCFLLNTWNSAACAGGVGGGVGGGIYLFPLGPRLRSGLGRSLRTWSQAAGHSLLCCPQKTQLGHRRAGGREHLLTSCANAMGVGSDSWHWLWLPARWLG